MHLNRPTIRNQSGFSAIEVLLIVFVVAALAATGLVVYQRHKQSVAKSSAAIGTTQTTGQQKSGTTTQPATQYLDIKEWGVKLSLSSAINDAYYSAGGNVSKDGLPNTVWIGLTSLNSTGCNATNTDSPSFKPLGAIVRVLPTDKDPGSGKLYTQQDPNGTTINGYYYGYASNIIKDSSCASATTLQSIDSAFATAAKNIVAATDPNYLVIKEWGIRAPYSGPLNLQYAANGSFSMAVSSSQLDAGGPAVCSAAGNSDAGNIARYLPTDADLGPHMPVTETAQQYIEQNPSVPHATIGSYIYIYWGNNYLTNGAYNGPCNDKAAGLQTISAYSALVPNLKAIPN
jgi:hypothetical protein